MDSRTYILADNQDITREGVVYLLDKIAPKPMIATASSCHELQEQLQMHPNSVVVLDYTLFDCSSVQQLLNMIDGAKGASWLLFSSALSETFLRQILFSGRDVCVVMKLNKKEVIVDALKAISAGEVYLCEIAKSIKEAGIPKAKKPNDTLTTTEKMVLREIALGKMTKEIAIEKNLSFHTVNTHRRNIFRKLEVNSAHEATKYALQAGLINVVEYYI